MDEEGACRGVMAWNLDDGTLHRFRAHMVILATGGYGRAYFSCTSAHTCTGDGNAMVLRAGLPLQDMEFVQFHPDRHLRRRLPDHRGRARRGRLPDQFRGRALHGALCAERQGPGLARRGQPLHDHRDPRGPRRRPSTRTTSTCTWSTSARRSSTSACPASPRRRSIFAGVDVTRQPIPVLPTVHYNMGGIPTNYHGEVVTLKDGNPEHVVPGLMAVGEAACVSVHGANRLGSNSLLDLVVFGRAAAQALRRDCSRRACGTRRCRRMPARPRIARLDKLRNADGERPTAEIRLEMQRAMQEHAAVFRTGEVLEEGVDKLTKIAASFADVKVADRSLIWNTDLVETLELDNLLGQALVTIVSRREPQGEPRRPCARGLPRSRRRELDEAHPGLARRRRPR